MNAPAATSVRPSAPRVWATRDEPPDGPLCAALRARGLDPVCEPVLARRVVADADALVGGLGPDDWLVLASEFAIAAVSPSAVRCRVAVVGEGSRRLATSRGLAVSLESPDSTGEGLWSELAGRVGRGVRVCYPRSSLAAAPGECGGVRVESPLLYETAPRAVDTGRVLGCVAAAVTSASAAREVVRLVPGVRCAVIGRTTAGALRAAGAEPWIVCERPGFEALADAVARGLGSLED